MAARFTARLEENVLAILLVSMTLLVFMEVVLRFGFNTGFLWAQELTLHISAWFVLFGASYGVKVGAHIGVDVLVARLPRDKRRIVSMVAAALCLLYCLLFLIGSWNYLSGIYEAGESLEDIGFPHWIANMLGEEQAWELLKVDTEDPLLPTWMGHSSLIFGFLLLVYRFLQAGWSFATGKADSFAHADEAKEALEHDLVAHDEENGEAKP